MPEEQTARAYHVRDHLALRLDAMFARADRSLGNNAAWGTAIALLLGLQITLILNHRPWADEFQALQLAVQTPRIVDLTAALRYEGHPALWYLVLRALGGLFRNQTWALPAAALLLAIPIQATVLLASPFSRTERLMVLLSQFILFECLTISRSLTLGIALLFLVAACWKRSRLVWLLISILPQCDFLFGAISLLLVALRWRQRRMFWPGFALWLAVALFTAWSIRPMPDMFPALLPKAPLAGVMLWAANISVLGLPLQWHDMRPQWNSPPPLGLGGFGFVGFFLLAWIELRDHRDYAIAFASFVLLTLVFTVAVYPLSIRHIAIVAAFLIFLIWRKGDDGSGKTAGSRSVWWRTWLLIAAACGVMTATISLIMPFDSAPEVVALINRLGLRDKTWVPYPQSAGQGVSALDSMTFERLGEHCSEDFIRWNSPDLHRVSTIDALNARLAEKLAQDGRFYLLTWYAIPEKPGLTRRIAFVPHGYDGQDFYMFVVGENRRLARPHGQPCSKPHPPLRLG